MKISQTESHGFLEKAQRVPKTMNETRSTPSEITVKFRVLGEKKGCQSFQRDMNRPHVKKIGN